MAQTQMVRFKSGKNHFEVLTKPGTVLKYREGKLGWDNVLISDLIYVDQSKGQKASSEQLRSAFGTDKNEDCLKAIVEKGDLQLTTAERKEKMDKKRAEILNYIHKYYVNPKTKTPHPLVRIENAFETMKVRLDPDDSSEKQANEIARKMIELIPLKKMEMEGTLSVAHQFSAQALGVVQKWAKVTGERFSSEGCVLSITLIPGDYDPLMADLYRITKGDFQFEIEGQGNAAATMEEEVKPAGKKGKGAKSSRQ